MSEEILEKVDELVDVSGEVDESVDISIEIPQRVNPFCVISKSVVKVEDINGKNHDLHMIETNSAWGSNPYGEDYAVVPDEMVQAILETRGFCDIVLSKDGTEVVKFTAREIPEFPQEEAPLTDIDILYEIEADQEFRLSCLELGLSADDFA